MSCSRVDLWYHDVQRRVYGHGAGAAAETADQRVLTRSCRSWQLPLVPGERSGPDQPGVRPSSLSDTTW